MIASLLVAYLLGAIPGSWLVARWAGRNLRELGDGNIGAHNVLRHVGRGWGMLALLIDAGKGVLAVLVAQAWTSDSWLMALAGWLAVVGHNYPILLALRGGKGLATALGVALALLPGLIWLTLGLAAIVIALTRNLAFAGLAVGVSLSVAAWIAEYPVSHVVAPLGLLLLMGWRQLPDLRRMWRESPDKRDLILNRWIRDRDAKL
jgi:acyl phosphate:glycerol-3-phosphate acyltransferase